MAIVKLFHVLFVFIWVGCLLALSRLMGYHVKEDDPTQARLARIYQRIYYFIELPCMLLALVFGLAMFHNLDWTHKPGWIHMKLTFIGALIVLDVVCMRLVQRLAEGSDHSRGIKYKMFHGGVGLTLIALLTAIFVVRDKEGEWAKKYETAMTAKTLGKNGVESYDISLSE